MIKTIAEKRKNRRAVSEVISYVLLIVIAMSLAAGVYAWMKFYVPSENEETCPDETALAIVNYTCKYIKLPVSSARSTIALSIENKGLFDVDGFFITASDDLNRPPFQGLNTTDNFQVNITGRYDFKDKLKPGAINTTNFVYNRTGELKTLKRIKIQPFKVSSTNITLPCPYIAEIRPENC